MTIPDVVLIPTVGRSGAGTLARLIASHGWSVPTPQVGPDVDNLFGYAESQWVLHTHRTWLGRLPLDADRGRLELIDVCREIVRAADVRDLGRRLHEAVERHGRIVVKDPRLTWFHRAWVSALAEAGLHGVTVAAVRAPADVVASKARSFGLLTSDEVRLRQWVVATVGLWDIVEHTIGATVVDVRDVVHDQAGTMRRLAPLLRTDVGPTGDAGIDTRALSVDSPWPDGLPAELRSLALEVHLAVRAQDRDRMRWCRSLAGGLGL